MTIILAQLDAEELEVQGYPSLHSKFRTSLGNLRHCSENRGERDNDDKDRDEDQQEGLLHLKDWFSSPLPRRPGTFRNEDKSKSFSSLGPTPKENLFLAWLTLDLGGFVPFASLS